MSDGIDYAATEAAMAAIQAENSHLFQFSQDTGLNYSPDGTLTASDIWRQLEMWYQDNGTLVYETASNDKVKALWFDQPRKGDHNVKGANQVLTRIQALFPKATRTTIYSATAKKSVPALKGVGFVATRPSADPVPTQYPPQETVTQQDGRPTRPSFSNFEQNQEILEETETDIENLADNCVAEFVAETMEPAFTGSGGSEPLDINVSICGTGAETGSGDAEIGSGGIEKPIAPLEPTEPTEPPAPQIAKHTERKPDIKVGDRVVAQKKHKEFEVGWKVTITEHVSPMYKGVVGTIIGKTYLGRTHTKYQVQLEKELRDQQSVVVEIPQDADGLVYLGLAE